MCMPHVGQEALLSQTCLLQCPAITNCKNYAADCSCAECNPFFSGAGCQVGEPLVICSALGGSPNCGTVLLHGFPVQGPSSLALPALAGVQCAIAATGCAEKNPDGCSCKACANGYKADGAGGCSQVCNRHSASAFGLLCEGCVCLTVGHMLKQQLLRDPPVASALALAVRCHCQLPGLQCRLLVCRVQLLLLRAVLRCKLRSGPHCSRCRRPCCYVLPSRTHQCIPCPCCSAPCLQRAAPSSAQTGAAARLAAIVTGQTVPAGASG